MSESLVGKSLGGIKIKKELGTGGMGRVYLGFDQKLEREVAVKVIAPLADSHRHDSTREVMARFALEAKAFAKFSHPHILQIYEVNTDGSIQYLVLEYAKGGDLAKFARTQPGHRLTPRQAIDLLLQAAKGLKEAAAQGIVHRDIKPANLLLGTDNNLKIADFGISKFVDQPSELTRGSTVGTPVYQSPEQHDGVVELDGRSDMYSLGVSFHYLLVGLDSVPKSTSEVERRVRLECFDPHKIRPEIPQDLGRVIRRLTQRDRKKRYASYDELLRELEALERSVSGDDAPTKETPAQRSKRAFRTRMRYAAVSALVLASGLLGAFALAKGRARPSNGPQTEVRDLVMIPQVPLVSDQQPGSIGSSTESPRAGPNAESLDPESALGSEPETGEEPETPVASAPAPAIPEPEVNWAELRDDYETQVGKAFEQMMAGPSDALKQEVKGLHDRVNEFIIEQEAPLLDVKQKLAQLLNELSWLLKAEAKLGKLSAPVTQLPLTSTDEYVGMVLAILDPSEMTEPSMELQSRLESLRRERLPRQFWERTLEYLDDQTASIESSVAQLSGESASDQLCRHHSDLEPVRVSLVDLDKAAVRVADASFVPEQSGALRGRLTKVETVIEAIRTAQRTRADLQQRLATLGRSSAWKRHRVRIRADVTQAGALLEQQLDVKELERQCGEWDTRLRSVEEALCLLGQRRPEDAINMFAGLPTGADLDADAIREAAQRLRDAFEAADRLDLDAVSSTVQASAGEQALNSLLSLDDKLDNRTAALQYVNKVRERFRVFLDLARAMVKIPSGKIAVRGDPEDVAGFLIDPQEATREEYASFVRLVLSTESADLPSGLRYELVRKSAWKEWSPATEQENRLPVDRVCYTEAMAYAAYWGKDLMTQAEWLLACRRGPDAGAELRPGAWGQGPPPTKDLQRLNPRRELVPVDEGGLHWAGHGLRHLAGNVCEWVKEDGSKVIGLIGAASTPPELSGLEEGRVLVAGPDQRRERFGFRTVLRPREFFELVWPCR